MKIFTLLSGVLIGGTLVFTANEVFSTIESKVDEKNQLTIKGETQIQEEIHKRNNIIQQLSAQLELVTEINGFSISPEKLLNAYAEVAEEQLDEIQPIENMSFDDCNVNKQSTHLFMKRFTDDFTDEEISLYKQIATKYTDTDTIISVLGSYSDSSGSVIKEANIWVNDLSNWSDKGLDWYEGDVHYKIHSTDETLNNSNYLNKISELYYSDNENCENENPVTDIVLMND